jgi:hypothetical protein
MHKVCLGFEEILFARGRAIVPQVDMFAPVELQNAVIGPIVIGIGNRISRLILARKKKVKDESN